MNALLRQIQQHTMLLIVIFVLFGCTAGPSEKEVHTQVNRYLCDGEAAFITNFRKRDGLLHEDYYVAIVEYDLTAKYHEQRWDTYFEVIKSQGVIKDNIDSFKGNSEKEKLKNLVSHYIMRLWFVESMFSIHGNPHYAKDDSMHVVQALKFSRSDSGWIMQDIYDIDKLRMSLSK